MTEQEKFIFKSLQWFIALGVTVMLFLNGYMITFIFNTYTWKGVHELKHNSLETYYKSRIVIDSTNCQLINKRVTELEQRVYQINKGDAILPKQEETTKAYIQDERY